MNETMPNYQETFVNLLDSILINVFLPGNFWTKKACLSFFWLKEEKVKCNPQHTMRGRGKLGESENAREKI